MRLIFKNLMLEVTRKCNMHCAHCMRGKSQNVSMDSDTVRNVFQNVSRIEQLTLTGGEPSLAPDVLLWIIYYAKTNGIQIGSFFCATNAKEYSQEFVDKLRELYGLCERPDRCILTVSTDQFHTTDLEVKKRYSELPFYKPEKEHSTIPKAEIILEGRAAENKLGRFSVPPETHIYDYELKGFQCLVNDRVYINALGDVLLNPDMSYENQDQFNFGNVFYAPLEDLLRDCFYIVPDYFFPDQKQCVFSVRITGEENTIAPTKVDSKVYYSKGLPTADHNINTAKLAHLMNRARMGYFPTEPSHVERLKEAIAFPEDPVNLIDPCCGEGIALQIFSEGTQARTYGIELDEVRGEEAQKRLHRVGFGSFFHSRISLNAFQGLWLNPPYLSVPSENGSRRLEKSFLADSMRLLQTGGILVYIIPHYRATPDVCRVLCENFTDLRVHKFIGKEFERFKQVAFIGVKTERREAEKMAKRLSEYMLNPENIPLITQLPKQCYTMPSARKKVELFKGAVFNVSELADQLKKSTSIERLFEDSTLDNRERRPLLPLNLSQVGLVGASGMMNGLVECDTPHIIKGRIVKEKKTKVGAEDNGKTSLREITSNRLIFNVLTSTGLKSLG